MVRLYISPCEWSEPRLLLNPSHHHYVANVMRMKKWERLSVFNEIMGEWEAILEDITHKKAEITLVRQVRGAVEDSYVGLYFAPLKSQMMHFFVEKATELGVTHFYPLQLQHGQAGRLNEERFLANAMQAVQQCERLDMPKVAPLQPLERSLTSLPSHHRLVAALEREEALPLVSVLQKLFSQPQVHINFLIGPEGGFSASEKDLLRNHPQVDIVTLGASILRAETAAIAMLATYQALKLAQ